MERNVKKRAQPAQPAEPPKEKSIVFFHPDLGIGGAERLVVDAAVGLQNLGHKVTVFTSYRDTDHCFEEARDGGYDTRVQENARCLKQLESLADSLKLKHATTKNIVSASNIPGDIEVLFLLSVPAQLKASLLHAAKLLIYTPSNEHFGIVPLEAMLAGVPVLAANSGGPLETVLDPETGWLRSVEKVDQWTEVMHRVLHEMTDAQLHQMGENGKRRVKEEFSETKLAHRLDEEITAMIKAPRVEATELGDIALSVPIIFCCCFAIGAVFFAYNTATEVHGLEIFLGIAMISVASIGIVALIWKLLQNESAFM
ncbi:hypothetical protein P7C71_g3923, partial [Lecanoromycetidae sp. Uapishka_2]